VRYFKVALDQWTRLETPAGNLGFFNGFFYMYFRRNIQHLNSAEEMGHPADPVDHHLKI